MKKFAVIGENHVWICYVSNEIDKIKGMEIASGIVSLEGLGGCNNPSGIDLKFGFYWTAVEQDLKNTGKLELTKDGHIIEIKPNKLDDPDAIYITRRQKEREPQAPVLS